MKRKNILTIAIVFFLLFTGWLLYENKAVKITEYEVLCEENPALSGFCIVQISDFHNEQFGEKQQKILKKVADCQPDMIAITGDFIDCRKTDVDAAMEFIEGAVTIAPVYYVPGNHECWVSEEYRMLCQRMEDAGVHLMTDRMERIQYQDAYFLCMGIEDPDFYTINDPEAEQQGIQKNIRQFEYAEEEFTLLLSHRPEVYEIYCQEKLDLVLTGHAHGGQFRFPFIGGVAAPNQGLFPTYDAGLFTDGTTHMIISRGIGNSVFPLRVNNPPEIVTVTLKAP